VPPESTPQLVHVTQEVVGRSVKITASVTVRKPGPEPYGFQEFAVYYGKEYPDTVNVGEARQEVAQEAVAALLDVGREYKKQYAAAHNPSSNA
jgi:hypothetical protein